MDDYIIHLLVRNLFPIGKKPFHFISKEIPTMGHPLSWTVWMS